MRNTDDAQPTGYLLLLMDASGQRRSPKTLSDRYFGEGDTNAATEPARGGSQHRAPSGSRSGHSRETIAALRWTLSIRTILAQAAVRALVGLPTGTWPNAAGDNRLCLPYWRLQLTAFSEGHFRTLHHPRSVTLSMNDCVSSPDCVLIPKLHTDPWPPYEDDPRPEQSPFFRPVVQP